MTEPKTSAEVQALFAEWRHDYEQAKVRDERGMEAVVPWPDPHGPKTEQLVDALGGATHDMRMHLDQGLQDVLEAHGVPGTAREAVREFTNDVIKDLGRAETMLV